MNASAKSDYAPRMIRADEGRRWVIVHEDDYQPVVARYEVPGGWLYITSAMSPAQYHRHREQHISFEMSWHPPVFVPSGKSP